MMLFEEGKLKLDDPVSKYLTGFDNLHVITKFNEKDATYEMRPWSQAVHGSASCRRNVTRKTHDERSAHFLSSATANEALAEIWKPAASFQRGRNWLVIGTGSSGHFLGVPR